MTGRWQSLAATMLLCALLVSACDTAPVPATAVLPTATGAAPPPSSDVSGFRTPQQGGDWTFSTFGFKRYEFFPAGKGSATNLKPTNGVFGVILLHATNTGGAAVRVDLSGFQLVDDAGHTYPVALVPSEQYSGEKGSLDAADQPVPAGETHSLGLVFDLPPTTYTFILHTPVGKLDPGPFPAR